MATYTEFKKIKSAEDPNRSEKPSVRRPGSTPNDDIEVEPGSLRNLLSCGVENALSEVIGNLCLIAGDF